MGHPRIALKPGVVLIGRNLEREPHQIIESAAETAPTFTDGTLWVTSATDGEHMDESKHYTGEAFDFRIRNITGGRREAAKWTIRLREHLGPDYDVVLESTHIHAEYDPPKVYA